MTPQLIRLMAQNAYKCTTWRHAAAGSGAADYNLTSELIGQPILVMGTKFAAGKCLSVATDNIILQMVPCNDATIFKYDVAGRLVSNATGQCVTVQNATATLAGGMVIMAGCAQPAALHQVWRTDDNAYLRPKHMMWGGLCLSAGSNITTVTACQDASVNGWAAGERPRAFSLPADGVKIDSLVAFNNACHIWCSSWVVECRSSLLIPHLLP
jgi:hypothetical protein